MKDSRGVVERFGFPDPLNDHAPRLHVIDARMAEIAAAKRAEQAELYELDHGDTIKRARERDAAEAGEALLQGKASPKAGKHEAQALARQEQLRKLIAARDAALGRLGDELAQSIQDDKPRLVEAAQAERDAAADETDQAFVACRDALRRLHMASAALEWIERYDAAELTSMAGVQRNRWNAPTHDHLWVKRMRGGLVGEQVRVLPLLADLEHVADVLADRIEHGPTELQKARARRHEERKRQLAGSQERRRALAVERARRNRA